MSSVETDNFAQSILEKFRKISQEQTLQLEKTQSNNYEEKESKEQCKRLFDSSKGPPSLTEAEVGISQFLTDVHGFSGILKHRFSDFHVNEIDLNGEVVQLTSLSVPEFKSQAPEIQTDVLTEEEWSKLENMITDKSLDNSFNLDVTEKTKEERSIIHKTVKTKYGSKVNSNTKDINEKKYIVFSKKNDGRSNWPSDCPRYLHFTLHKINMDTTDVVQLLADKLRLRVNMVTYAGTKDRRGHTTQRMCIKMRTAETVSKVRLYKVTTGNYEYRDKEIRLGDTCGNRFTIAIRKFSEDRTTVDKALEALRKTGFINYFGLQRFGTFSQVPTYKVGLALLASDWKKAVELLLTPKENTGNRKKGENLKTACAMWNLTKDPIQALKMVPKYDKSIEALVLRSLKEQGPNSYLNAIMKLPRNTMILYLHSYQSLIWNKIVSKRIEKYGLTVLAGDLVLDESTKEILLDEASIEVVNEESANETKNEDEEENEEQQSYKDKREIRVRCLSDEEAKTTSITDVLYPLPGHNVTYPQNDITDWYKELLSEDNFTLTDFGNCHKNFSLKGAYRKLLGVVKDLTWEFKSYKNPDDDLILSDIEKLKGKSLSACDPNKANYNAVVMSFALDTCCYATMALREAMKTQTSKSFHSNLSRQDDDASKEKRLKTK